MGSWQKLLIIFSFLRVQIIPLGKLKLFMAAIFLVAVVNGAAASFFLGVSQDDFFYEIDENTLIISDSEATTPITGLVPYSLVELLSEVEGITAISPELLALCVMSENNQPVTVRGVADVFREIVPLEMQSGVWLFSENVTGSIVIVGKTLSEQLGLQLGQSILLSSSVLSEIVLAHVGGIFETGLSFDEEILASLDFTRNLRGSNPGDISLIRVEIDLTVTSKSEIKNFVKNLGKDAIIQGYVHDDASSQPLSGVQVKAYFEDSFTKMTHTDINGLYTLSLTPGNYRFAFEVNNYHVLTVTNITLEPGARFPLNVDLKRKRTVIQGLVLDSDTYLPLTGCSVYLKDEMNLTIEEVQTNNTGHFKFSGVSVGNHFFLDCDHPDYFRILSSFASLELFEDAPKQINLFLAPHLSNFTGYVTALDSGLPVVNASVTLRNANYDFTNSSDDQGRYTFLGLAEGNYSMIISHVSYAPAYTPIFLMPNQHQVLNSSLYLPGSVIPGIHTLWGGIKEGLLNQSLSEALVELRAASNNQYIASTLAFPNGTFRFSDIPDLDYKITIFAFNLDYWPKTVDFNFSGNQTGFIDVVVSPKLSTLVCLVMNNITQEIVADFLASLSYEDQSPTQITSTAQYVFGNLLPGTYTLDIQHEDYVSANQTFQLQLNSRTLAIFNLLPKNGSISGQIISLESGQPLQSVLVQLLSSSSEVIAEQVSSSEGRFLFTNVFSGNYSLKMTKSGYPVQYVYNITLLPNQLLDLSLIYFQSINDNLFGINFLNRLFQINSSSLSSLQFDSEGVEEILSVFETVFYAMVLLLVLLSTLSILSVVSQPIRESQNELILLRVLGATNKQVALSAAIHLMFSALISAAIGVVLGGLVISSLPIFKTIQIGFLLINPAVDLTMQVIIIGFMVLLVGFTSFNLVLSKKAYQKTI